MKTFKKIAVIVLSVVLSLSLCSCRAIDEMRKSRAVYADEKKTEILINDQTFILVEEWNNDFDTSADEYITVSQKDVPLLAAQFVGSDAYLANGNRIICVNYSRFYVREDVYEYAKNAKIENLTQYCYEYYNEEKYEYDYSYLGKELSEKIDNIIKNQKGSEETPEIATWVSVYKTDDVMLLTSLFCDINMDIDGKMTISVFDEEESIDVYYEVPSEYEKDFADFVAKNSMNSLYYDTEVLL